MQKRSEIKVTTYLSIQIFVCCCLLYVLVKLVSPVKENADYINPAESLLGLNIPKDIHFCGEAVPQDDYSIKENLDKEFSSHSSSLAFILFKRASLWFLPIESVLNKNNIPDDIKYIAVVESKLTNSRSPQGAAGFWQFVPSTAINYGLEVNEEVDERYSIEKSTQAACKFFKEAYARFNSWTIAAAAYNLGMGGIGSKLKKQGSKNYYDLMLNKETSVYMYRLLALKTLFENSNRKRYHGSSKSFYNIPLTSYKVDSAVQDLSLFAAKLGYDYNTLKIFNPWLRSTKLSNPEKKTYIINFPKKEFMRKDFAYLEGDLLRDRNDSVVQVKKDSNEKNIQKKDTANERSH